MSPSSTRRAVLGTVAASSLAAFTGCAGLTNRRELAREVEVFNHTDTAHTISVRVTAEDGDTLYRRTFDLDAEMGEEDTEPFGGAPHRITVTIDDRDPVRQPWPTPDCEERGVRSAGGVAIKLLEDRGLFFVPTCNTVYVES